MTVDGEDNQILKAHGFGLAQLKGVKIGR